jgi:hypothetical protein
MKKKKQAVRGVTQVLSSSYYRDDTFADALGILVLFWLLLGLAGGVFLWG